MGWKQGASECSSRLEQRWQHRQLPGLQGAGGSLSISGHTPLSFKTPAALPVSGVHPAGSGTACRAEDEDEVKDEVEAEAKARGVTAALPSLHRGSRPRWGTGCFPAFRGASFSSFNYICGLDRFAWPLKSISQRVVLKQARNICGGCGFPPGLQEE